MTTGLNQLHYYLGRTLIDCTKTNDISLNNSKLRNQHRNWETLAQVLGLRTQIIELCAPTVSDINVSDLKFGSTFTSKQRVWTFEFGVEYESIFADNVGPVGVLENDFVNVPIILGLDETATIQTPVFCIDSLDRNIYFEPI